MAFYFEQLQENGFVCNYWRITRIEFDSEHLHSYVLLTLYKDKKARDDGRPGTGKVLRYDWKGEDYPFTVEAMQKNDPYKIAYEKIKSLKTKKTILKNGKKISEEYFVWKGVEEI